MIVGDHGCPLTTVEDLNLLEIEIKIGTWPQWERLIDEKMHPEFLKDVPKDNWQRSRAPITEQLAFEDQKIDTEGAYDINESLPQLQPAKHVLDPQELQREFENVKLVEIRAALGPRVF